MQIISLSTANAVKLRPAYNQCLVFYVKEIPVSQRVRLSKKERA